MLLGSCAPLGGGRANPLCDKGETMTNLGCVWLFVAVLLAPTVAVATAIDYGDGAYWLVLCRGESDEPELQGEHGRALCDTALRFFALGHVIGMLEPQISRTDASLSGDAAVKTLGSKNELMLCVGADSTALPQMFAQYIEDTPREKREHFPQVAHRFMRATFNCLGDQGYRVR